MSRRFSVSAQPLALRVAVLELRRTVPSIRVGNEGFGSGISL